MLLTWEIIQYVPESIEGNPVSAQGGQKLPLHAARYEIVVALITHRLSESLNLANM